MKYETENKWVKLVAKKIRFLSKLQVCKVRLALKVIMNDNEQIAVDFIC